MLEKLPIYDRKSETFLQQQNDFIDAFYQESCLGPLTITCEYRHYCLIVLEKKLTSLHSFTVLYVTV